jgi:hypothetical protein
MIKNKSFVIRNDSQSVPAHHTTVQKQSIDNFVKEDIFNEAVANINTKFDEMSSLLSTLSSKVEVLKSSIVSQEQVEKLIKSQPVEKNERQTEQIKQLENQVHDLNISLKMLGDLTKQLLQRSQQ